MDTLSREIPGPSLRNVEELRKRAKQWRDEQNLSQSEVATGIGVATQTYGNWERGQSNMRKRPLLTLIQAMESGNGFPSMGIANSGGEDDENWVGYADVVDALALAKERRNTNAMEALVELATTHRQWRQEGKRLRSSLASILAQLEGR